LVQRPISCLALAQTAVVAIFIIKIAKEEFAKKNLTCTS